MCLTKGPQSLGSSAELGISSQEGLLSQVLEAFQRNDFAIQVGKSETWSGEGSWFLAPYQDHIPTDTGISTPHGTASQRHRPLHDGRGATRAHSQAEALVHRCSLRWERTHTQ